MSLETAITENTAAIRELIAALTHGPIIAQDVDTGKKRTPAGKPAANARTEPTVQAAADDAPENKPASTNQSSDASQAADNSGNVPQGAAAQTAAEPATDTTAQSAATGAAATYEDAKAAVLALGKAKGRDTTLEVLSRFGASKLPDVKPEAFADLIELANHVINGGEV